MKSDKFVDNIARPYGDEVDVKIQQGKNAARTEISADFHQF